MILYRPNTLTKIFHPGAIWRCKGNGVLITIDDGPGGRRTEKILEELEKINCRAVFFLTGEKIRGQENLLREIISFGHIIGNHGYRHSHFIISGRGKVLDSILRTNDVVEEATGVKVNYFRSPYGSPSLHIPGIMNELRMKNIMWSLLSYDFRGSFTKTRDILVKYALPKDIIVFHDNEKSADVFPGILPFFKDHLDKKGIPIEGPECLN